MLPLLLWNFDHGLGFETEHASNNVRRERLHGIVEFLGSRIEETANGSQFILHIGNFSLKLDEKFVSLQLRIRLEGDLQSSQCI